MNFYTEPLGDPLNRHDADRKGGPQPGATGTGAPKSLKNVLRRHKKPSRF